MSNLLVFALYFLGHGQSGNSLNAQLSDDAIIFPNDEDLFQSVTSTSTQPNGKLIEIFPDNCGIQSYKFQNERRIKRAPNLIQIMVVGGTDARVGVHPWIARIGQNGRFFCGGALITAKHVVTAAHCLGKRGEYMVRLGDHDKDDDSDPGRIDVVVKAMIPHEKYLKAKQLVQNDIAILLLKESVKFTDRISPICLPMAGLRNLDLANRSVTVAGWGALSYGGEKAKVLQQANLIVTPHNECIQSYKSIKLLINNDQICANNPGKDACGGDSGGPLTFFYPESRRHYLVGIVSFGYKCADERFPGVYARTTSYMNWITEKVMNMN